MGNPMIVQSVKQIAGMALMALRFPDALPAPGDGASRICYALPFDGAWSVLNGGVTEETSHSWDVWTQRYAYDFLVLDEAGSSRRPGADPSHPASYFCYGLPVLAPADGTVVEAHEGCPDAPVALDGRLRVGGDDIRGNHVVIEHAHGEFSCLAHLAAGSVAVRTGEAVACGQPVGRCGSSGASTEPHLHFHVQKGRSFYSSPGVPVRFADVCAEPAPNYAAADPRPISEGAHEAFPPFLVRGMRVRNVGRA